MLTRRRAIFWLHSRGMSGTRRNFLTLYLNNYEHCKMARLRIHDYMSNKTKIMMSPLRMQLAYTCIYNPVSVLNTLHYIYKNDMNVLYLMCKQTLPLNLYMKLFPQNFHNESVDACVILDICAVQTPLVILMLNTRNT